MNSIHKSCKLQNNWFKFDGLRKRHKNTDFPIRYFPPDEHALYKDNFATGNGELSKVIADIAQRDGNVFFMFHEHYKCLRCELPICNKCSVFEAIAVVFDTLFLELYVMRVFSFYFSQLIATERPDEHCISTFR